MKVLITGGAGYVGSVVAQQCLAAGHEIVVIDNLVFGHRAAVPPGAVFVEGDISDTTLVRGLLTEHRIDAVAHLAAWSIVGQSMREPQHFFDNNVRRALALLDAMRESGVMRFVFSSTASVFGEPIRMPIDEDHPKAPINAYGESKLMLEVILERYRRTFGLQYAAFRYFNAAGASGELGEDHRPETHVIPLILRAAAGRSTQPFQIFGRDYATPDGTCLRDYVHVIDLARAHVLALEKLDEVSGMSFNLGSQSATSVLELIHAVERITGRRVPSIDRERRAGDPSVLLASSARAREVLGWDAQHSSIDNIIETAWRWFEAHPDGYPD